MQKQPDSNGRRENRPGRACHGTQLSPAGFVKHSSFSNQVRCLHLSAAWLCAGPVRHAELESSFDAARLEALTRSCARLLSVKILNLSHAAYEPSGASSSALLAEVTQLAHLAESHISLHTYTDPAPDISKTRVFRLDLDLATCGQKSPSCLLKPLLQELGADFYAIDLLLRGFTREADGNWGFPGQDEALPDIALTLKKDFRTEHEWSRPFRQHRLKLAGKSALASSDRELLEELFKLA